MEYFSYNIIHIIEHRTAKSITIPAESCFRLKISVFFFVCVLEARLLQKADTLLLKLTTKRQTLNNVFMSFYHV